MKSLLAILSLIILAGCATTGSAINDLNFANTNKTIFLSQHFSGYEERHIGEVIRTFEKYGFKTSNDRDTSDYFLDFSISAGVTITVRIALMQNGKNVVEVESTNAGWGTLMARAPSVASRVEAAILEMNQLLSKGVY